MTNGVAGPRNTQTNIDKHVVGTDLEDFQNNVFRGSLSEHDSKRESKNDNEKSNNACNSHLVMGTIRVSVGDPQGKSKK